MRLLLDTNILLEVLLAQTRTEEAKKLLVNPAGHDLFMSDFTLHSIGVVLFRRRQPKAFRDFVKDLLLDSGILLLALAAEDTEGVVSAADAFNLDFDDAYQYALAEKHGLMLVSFDGDFDRTTRGRQTPSQILSAQTQ